jgi:phosphoesterase RecJ-like protein
MFRFLVPDDGWILHPGSEEARDVCAQADLAVVLDTGEVPRIGRLRSMIRDLKTVVVDHHPPGEKPLGGISLRDDTACATGELIYDVFLDAGGPWEQAALDGMYAAILTDTGSFRFTNSTPECHRVTAELIERGVDPEEMYSRIYGSAPVRKYRLLERALATLEFDADSGIAWMTVPTDAFRELEAIPDDLEGMVDVPRGVEGAHVGLLFRSSNSGEIKVSFRSNGPVDVNQLAREFGGGGHVRASGCMVEGPMERAIDEVLGATRRAVARDLDQEELA